MQPSGGHGDIIKACIQILKSPEFAHVTCRETTNASGEKILEVTREKQLGLLGDNLHPVTVTLTEAGLCTVAVLFRPTQRLSLQVRDLQHLIDLLQRVADPVRHVFCPGILPDQAKLCEKDKRLVVHQHPFRRYQAADCPVWYQLSLQPGTPPKGPLQMCPSCQCLVSAYVQVPGSQDGPPPSASAAVSRIPIPRAVTTAAPSVTYPALAARISSTAGSLPPTASVTKAPCTAQQRHRVRMTRPPDSFPSQVVMTCAGGVVSTAANSVGHMYSLTSVAASHSVPTAPDRQMPLSVAVGISSSGVVPPSGHRQSYSQGCVVNDGPVLQGATAGHINVTATSTAAVTTQHGSSGFPHGAGAASSSPVPAASTRNNIVAAAVPEDPRTALTEMIQSGCPVQVRGSSSSQVPQAGANVPDQDCEIIVPLTQASNSNPSVRLSSGPTDGPLDLSQVKVRNSARHAVNSSLQGLPLVLSSGIVALENLGRTPDSQCSNHVPPSAVLTAGGRSTSLAKSALPQNVPVSNPPRCLVNSSSGCGGPQIVMSSVPHSQALLMVSRGPAPVPAQQPLVMQTSTQMHPSQRDFSYTVAGPSAAESVTWTRTLTSDTLSSAQAPAHPSPPTAHARSQPPGAISSPEWLASQTSQRVPLPQSGTGQNKKNLKIVPGPTIADQISTLVAQKASNTCSGPSGSAAAVADSILTGGRPSNSATRPAQTWQNGRAPGVAEQGGDLRGFPGTGVSGRPVNASSQSAAQNSSTVEVMPSGNQHPPTSAIPPSPTLVQTAASQAQLPVQPLRLPTVTSGYLPPSSQVSVYASSAPGATGAAAAGAESAERDRHHCLPLPVKKRHIGRQPLPEVSDSSAVVSNGPRFSTPNTATHVRFDFIRMPSSGSGSLRAPLVSTTPYRGPPPLAPSPTEDDRYEQFQIKKPPSQLQVRDVQALPQGAQGQLSAAPPSALQAPVGPSSQVMLRLVQSHHPPAVAASTAASSNSVPIIGPMLGSSPAVSSAGPHQAVLSTAAAAVAPATPAVTVSTGNATTAPSPLYPPGAVVFKIPNPVSSPKPAKKPRSRSSSAKSRSKQPKDPGVIFIPISFQSAVSGAPVTGALPPGAPVVALLDNGRPVLGKDAPMLRFHTTLATPIVAPNAPPATEAVGQSTVMETQSGQVNMQSGSLNVQVRAANVTAPATNAGSTWQMPGLVQGPSIAALTKDHKEVTNSQQEPPSTEGTGKKKRVKRLQKASTSPSKKTSASPSRRKSKTKEQAAVPATEEGQVDPSQMNPTGNAAENAPRQSRSPRKARSSGSRSRERKAKPKPVVGEGEHPPASHQDSAAPTAAPTAAAASAPAAAAAASLPPLPADAEPPQEGAPGVPHVKRKAKKKKRFTVRRRPRTSREEPQKRDKARSQSRRRRKKMAVTTLHGTRIKGFSPSGLAGSDSRPTTEEDSVATRVRSKARKTRNTGPWLGIVPGHGSGQNGDSALWYENASSEKSDAWIPVNASPEGVTIHFPEVASPAERSASAQDQPGNSLFSMLIVAASSALDELNSKDPQASHSNDDSTRNNTGQANPEAEPRTGEDVYDFQDDSTETPKSTEENGLTSTVSRESASNTQLGGSKRHNKSLVRDVTNDSPIMTSATCVSNPERSASLSPATPETASGLTASKWPETGTRRQAPVNGESDTGLSSGQNVAAAAVSTTEYSKENGPRSCEGKDQATNVDRYRPNAASSASETAVAVQSSPPQKKEGGGAPPLGGTRPSTSRLLSEEEESRLTIDESPSAQMENEVQANPQHARRTKGATWCCSICQAEYKNQDLLQHHMKIHTAWKPFYCSVCKKIFPSSDVLRAHVAGHGDSRLKLCNICYKVLQGKGELCRHQKKHRKPGRVSCSVCFMSFQKASSLQMHMGCHNKGSSWGKQKKKVDTGGYEPIVTQEASSDGDNLAKIFSCPHCKRSFKTLRWCRLHMPMCLVKQQERERKKAVRQERARLVKETKRQRSSKRKKEAWEPQDPLINKSELGSLTSAADQLPPPAEEEEDHTVQDTHEIGGIITPELSSLQEEDVEDDADADAEDGSDMENPGTPSTVAYLITPPCSPSEAYHGRWDDVPFEQEETGPVEVKVEPADTVEWEEGAMFAIRTEATPPESESEGLAFAAPLDLPVLTPPNPRRSLILQSSRNASNMKPPVPEEGDGSGVVAEELSPLEEASTTDPPIASDKNDHNDLHTSPGPGENDIQPVIMEVKSVPESEFHSGFYPEETTPLSPATSGSESFVPCTTSADTSATSQDDSFCQEHEQTTSLAPASPVNGAVDYDTSDECSIIAVISGPTLAPVQDTPAFERTTQLPGETLETAPQDVLDSSQYPVAAVSQTFPDAGTTSDDVGVCGRASVPDVSDPVWTSMSEERPSQISSGSDSPPPLLLPQDAPFGSDLTHGALPPVLTRIDQSCPQGTSSGEGNDSYGGCPTPQSNPEGPFRALTVTRQDAASSPASGQDLSGAFASPNNLISRLPTSGMSLPVVIHRVYDPSLEKRSTSTASALTCVRDTVFSKRKDSQVQNNQDATTSMGNSEKTESSENHQSATRPAATSKETETRRKFDLLFALARSRKARRRHPSLSNTSEDDAAMDMIEVDVAEDLQVKDTETVAAAADGLDAGDGTNETQLSDAPPNAELDKSANQEEKGKRPTQEKKSEKNHKVRGRNGTKTFNVAGKIRSQKKAKKSKANPASENAQGPVTLWRDTSPLPMLISPKRYIRGKKYQYADGAEMLPAKVNICERVKQRKRPERNLCEKTIFRQMSAWAVQTNSPRSKRKSPLGSALYRRKRMLDTTINRKNSLKQWRSRQSSPCKTRRLLLRSRATTSRRKSTEADVDGADSTQESGEDTASDHEDALHSAARSGVEVRRPAVSYRSQPKDSLTERHSATSSTLQEDAASPLAPKLPTKSSCPRVVVKRLTSMEVSCASGRKGKRVKEAGPVVDDVMGSTDTDDNDESADLSLSSPQVLNAADNEDEDDDRVDYPSDEENEAPDAVDVAQHVTAEDSNQTLMLSVEAAERPEARGGKTDPQHFLHPNKEGLFVSEAMKYKHILKEVVIRLSRCDPVIIEHLKKIGQNNVCHSANETPVDSDGWMANQDEEYSDDVNDYAFVTPDVCNDEFDSADDDEAGAVTEDTHQTSEREDDGADMDATTGSNAVRMQTSPSPLPSSPPPPSPCPSVSPPSPKNMNIPDVMSDNPEATPAEVADDLETSQETPCDETASSDVENLGEVSTQTPSDHPTAGVMEEEEEEREDCEIFPEMFSFGATGHRRRRHLARRRPYYDSDDSEQEVTWSGADKGRSSTARASTDNHPTAASAPGSKIVKETIPPRDQQTVEKRSANVCALGLSSQYIKPGPNFTNVPSSSSSNGDSAGDVHMDMDIDALMETRDGAKEIPFNKSTMPRNDQPSSRNDPPGSVRAEGFPGSAKTSTPAANEGTSGGASLRTVQAGPTREQTGNKDTLATTHSVPGETKSPLAMKRKREETFQAASKRFKNAAIEPSVSSPRNPGQPQMNGLSVSKNCSVVGRPSNLPLSDIRVQLTRKDKVPSNLLPSPSGQGSKEQSRLTPTGTVAKTLEESTNSTATATPEKMSPRYVVTLRSKDVQTPLATSHLRSRSGCREPEMNGDVLSSPTRRSSSGDKYNETSRTPRSSSAESLSRSPLSPARSAGLNGQIAGASRKRKDTSPERSPRSAEKRLRGHTTRSSSRESDASRSPSTGRKSQTVITKSWFMRDRSPLGTTASPDKAQRRTSGSSVDRDASPSTAAKPRTATVSTQKNDDSGKFKGRTIAATGGIAENGQPTLKSHSASDSIVGQTLSSPQTVHVAVTRNDVAKMKTPYIPLVSIDSQPRNGATTTRLEDRNIFSMFGDPSQ